MRVDCDLKQQVDLPVAQPVRPHGVGMPRRQARDLVGTVNALAANFQHAGIEVGGLDIHNGSVVGFVVSSSCDYFASIAFPDRIEIGLRVGKLGNSSVQYELAVFKADEEEACAAGRFVHVFVDRSSNRPVSIPENLRAALTVLLMEPAA